MTRILDRANMLLMSSTKLQERHYVLGATSAMIAGSLVAFAWRRDDFAGDLLDQPAVVALGIVVAGIGGARLARRVIDRPRIDAIETGLFLGIIVPMATAGLLTTILAPIGIWFGIGLWPVTIPAGLLWTVIVRRLARLPALPDQAIRGGVAVCLSFTLLALRYIAQYGATS